MFISERYNQCILYTTGSHIISIRERGRGGRKHGLIPGRKKTFSLLLSITLAQGHTHLLLNGYHELLSLE